MAGRLPAVDHSKKGSSMHRREFLSAMAVSALVFGSPRSLARTAGRVVVVGAGIIGASIAYHLARRGAQVTLVEKSAPASGTTRCSFAWLNSLGKRPYSYYDLNYKGILGWNRLQRELGPSLQVQWGGAASWCRDDPKEVRRMVESVRESEVFGYPIHAATAEDLTAALPGVRLGSFGAGLLSSTGGTVDPVAATQALVKAAKAHGAILLAPASVRDIVVRGGRAVGVETDQGPIPADEVVLAAGNDIPDLARKVGLNVPLKLSRGVLAHSKPHAALLDKVVMPPGCDIKQNPDGRIVTGSNFGDSGDLPASMEVGREFLSTAAGFFPEMAGLGVDFMTLGYRVLPADGHPIIGRSKVCPNAHVAAMHSGMTLAPVVGELVAMEVLDQIETTVLSDFRPARFG